MITLALLLWACGGTVHNGEHGVEEEDCSFHVARGEEGRGVQCPLMPMPQ